MILQETVRVRRNIISGNMKKKEKRTVVVTGNLCRYVKLSEVTIMMV